MGVERWNGQFKKEKSRKVIKLENVLDNLGCQVKNKK